MSTIQSAVRVYPLQALFADPAEVEDRHMRVKLLQCRRNLYEDVGNLHHSVWHSDAHGNELRVFIIPGLMQDSELDELVGHCLGQYVNKYFLVPQRGAFRLVDTAATVIEDISDLALIERMRRAAKSGIDRYERLLSMTINADERAVQLGFARVCALAYAQAIPA